LQNLNFKYREKLGISNEPIDAINPVNECTHENIQMKSSGIWKTLSKLLITSYD
jgi:hypothetical protein